MAFLYLLSCVYLFFCLLVFVYDSVAQVPNDKCFSKFISVSGLVVFVVQTSIIITSAVLMQSH